MEQKTKIIAEDGRQDLHILRDFNISVELLFKAYSEPSLIEQWMGTKVTLFENKDHGSFRFETSKQGRTVFKANGTIHKTLLNQNIVRTFEMEDTPIGVQLEFLHFEKLSSEKSRLNLHIIYQSEKHRAEQLKLPFAFGLSMAHDKLENILSESLNKNS